MNALRFAMSLTLMVISSSAFAEPSFRTTYEITIGEGKSVHTVHTASAVHSGVAIEHELSTFKFTLLPEVDSAGAYTLDVSVGRMNKLPRSVFLPTNERFEGVVGIPLEFTFEFGSATVSGAIVISELGR